MKKLSKKKFLNIVLIILVICVGSALYMIAAETGLYALLRQGLAGYGEMSYFYGISLTLLAGLVAALIPIAVLRRFTDMPKLSAQFKQGTEAKNPGAATAAKDEAQPFLSAVMAVLGICLGVVGWATLHMTAQTGRLFVFQIVLLVSGIILFIGGVVKTVTAVIKK